MYRNRKFTCYIILIYRSGWGKLNFSFPYITELLSDLKFLICPLSQFQSVFRIIMVRKAKKAVVISVIVTSFTFAYSID